MFDYLYEAEGELASIDADDVYGCAEVVVRELSARADFMVVRLDRPVVGREPVRVARARDLGPGQGLVMIGFPEGTPAKIDDGGSVVRPTHPDGLDGVLASTDSFEGSSGSGVFDAEGDLVGILVGGSGDYVVDGGCLRAARIGEAEASESVLFAEAALLPLCESGRGPRTICGGCSATRAPRGADEWLAPMVAIAVLLRVSRRRG